jgi:hypothetical protein
MLADAKAGRSISRSINLAEPVDHTADYDRILAMLEMSVDDTIMLDAQEFNQYVLDNWEWSRLASYTNQSYAIGTPVPRAPKRWDNEDY